MRPRIRHTLLAGCVFAISAFAIGVAYVAFPQTSPVELPAPLESEAGSAPHSEYAADFDSLRLAFRPQRFRSFCGPASIETVLRAYGANIDQTEIFPTLGRKADTFFTGMSLTELSRLAEDAGLKTERIHADGLTIDTFRERLKNNLRKQGDFVLVNYDRRALKQEGAGHISPVGAYDETTDRFLILDVAAYKYPFTWVPTKLLFEAVHTQAGKRWRGALFIYSYSKGNLAGNEAVR